MKQKRRLVTASRRGVQASANLSEGLLGEHAPLVEEPVEAPAEAADGSCADLAEMEEGRPSAPPAAQPTVQELLWKAPGEAVRWLETRGCAKLGSFKVQARPQLQGGLHPHGGRGAAGNCAPAGKGAGVQCGDGRHTMCKARAARERYACALRRTPR